MSTPRARPRRDGLSAACHEAAMGQRAQTRLPAATAGDAAAPRWRRHDRPPALADAMEKLPPDQRDSAAAAFRFLVTSSGRKIALTAQELSEFSAVPAAPMEPALA